MRKRSTTAVKGVALGVMLGASLLAGCGTAPGQPASGSEVIAPSEISDFETLYSQNCAGCHGAEGKGGAAIALASPVYLAVADDVTIRKVVSAGVKGTAMPAFAVSSGGLLTEKQIDVLTQQIRARWGSGGTLNGVSLPAYTAASAGDTVRGEAAYRTFCESCHGAGGRGGSKGSAITNDSFLALVSDQGLRTIVIAGRPELGAPDFRGNAAGKAMSDQEITDVVAWLASHRAQDPGEPYPVANQAPHANDAQPH